ncbi:hypothetical protein KFE98_06715 [bacterium SCSIO 12741]|nr:hypothetical protein KFE98_06715 [bacterium SCSIO 12741]
MERYEIRLSGLSTGKHTFQFELDKKFFEFFEQNGFGENLIQDGSLAAEVLLDKRESMLELNFTIEGSVSVPCDLCMNPMDVPMAIEQRVVGKFTDEPSWHEDELIHISLRHINTT